MELVKKYGGRVAAATAACFLAVQGAAYAVFVPYDLAPATSDVGTQITGVLTDVLPVAGGIIALFIGWKIVRRMVKA